MVFWITYPILNLFDSLCNTAIFKSLVFQKEPYILPANIECIIYNRITNSTSEIVLEIQSFIKRYFGNPPHTPVLDIPEVFLLTVYDCIIVLRYNSQIIGTIRYHYMGEFINKERIYCVDCFCIHPNWRKKGMGDILLSELHNYANQNNLPYCMFLKEGSVLPIMHLPLYSGTYVYRKVSSSIPCISSTIITMSVSVKNAYRIMDILRQIQPNLFIIRNHKSSNQVWKLYKHGMDYILTCIQNTFQTVDRQTMGWVTAWIESPLITDSFRKDVSEQLLHTCEFDYLWLNHKWIGDSTEWNTDGTFHWYSYQWTSAIHIDKSYCILT